MDTILFVYQIYLDCGCPSGKATKQKSFQNISRSSLCMSECGGVYGATKHLLEYSAPAVELSLPLDQVLGKKAIVTGRGEL